MDTNRHEYQWIRICVHSCPFVVQPVPAEPRSFSPETAQLLQSGMVECKSTKCISHYWETGYINWLDFQANTPPLTRLLLLGPEPRS